VEQIKKIALWSGPRNISTALMYSFANRSDTAVVDEPLFGYFLEHTGVWRPSREEVLATMETDASNIVDTLINPPTDMPVYFMKHMANHVAGLELDFLQEFDNILLIRDPKDVLLSYSRNVTEPTLLDTAYKMQLELLDFFTKNSIPYVILNAKNVLLNPENQLTALCENMNISFQHSMLDWEAGPRHEDGIWAKYWYESVHKSTGFVPYKEKNETMPPNLHSLYHECMYFYEKMEHLALT